MPDALLGGRAFLFSVYQNLAGASMPKSSKPRVYILPTFTGRDTGDGGIRRVVEAQQKYFPDQGLKIVDSADKADILLCHVNNYVEPKSGQVMVAQCHGLMWSPEYNWTDKWPHKVNREVIDTMLKADVVLSPSEWVSQAIRRNTLLPAITVYHGVDTEEWTPSGTSGDYVLWNKSRPDEICDPTPLNYMASKSRRTRFITTFGDESPNVKVLGRVPFADMKKLVQEAGVYLATTRETFGVGTLEAMACGVPVLGYNWGGQREIIRHKVEGYLVTPGNEEGLLEGLDYCLENRESLGSAARERAKEFSWERAAKLYAKIFREALTNKPSIKVSVVITAYNLAQYLPDAISSVMAQDHAPSFEIVIVDDASTDETPKIADRFAAAHPGQIRVIHNPKNLYLAGALNVGIEASRGEYIIPLDADNMLGPKALYVLSEYLDKDRSLDIAYGRMEVRKEGEPSSVSSWPPKEADFAEQMKHHNQISSTAMYRKKIWQRVGGYRRRCRTAEDADFWCRALSFGARGAQVTPQTTLIYRDRSDSMSHVEKDWDWHAWYSWSRRPELTPAAVLNNEVNLLVKTFEPTAISVVIPVAPYHHDYLADAIDSVISQTFQRWEVVIVFDSPSAEKPPTWVPPFAKVLFTGGGKGPAYSRNLGIEVSKGKLILPLDADDYLRPDALQQFYDAWQQRGGYIYSDWWEQEAAKAHETQEYSCEGILRQLPHAVTALFSKEAWVEAGGFDADLDAWEDWDFYLALASKGYCGHRVPEPLLYYRIHAGQRREEQYARKDELAANIRAKWSRYFSGEAKLMACGGCRGAKTNGSSQKAASQSQSQGQNSNIAVESEGNVLVEYVGQITGPMTFQGVSTGTRYRFGMDANHKRRPVARGDVPAFLARMDFQLVKPKESTAPFLAAAGPPKR